MPMTRTFSPLREVDLLYALHSYSPSSARQHQPLSKDYQHVAHELSTDELLSVLATALEYFRDTDDDITAARIGTLIAVAQNPAIQQVDVADFVKGLSTSGISRNVLDWSELDTKRRPGPDFINQRADPEYRRRNLLHLTPKGHLFLERLTVAVNKGLKKRR
jgi:DNA-binding MarR family transcriptional regulator